MSRKCGGFPYVSVSAASCRNACLQVEYHELSSFPCLRCHCNPAYHKTYERQKLCSCEVSVGPFLFDFTRDQSTSHFHTFTAALVNVYPSTREGLASRPSPFRRLRTCRTTPSLPHLLWSRRLERVYESPSNSSHTSSPHIMSSSTPGSGGRLPALIGPISTSFPAVLLADPPVFPDSNGGPTSSRRARFGVLVLLEFRSPSQVVFESLRVCKIGFHPGGHPTSALLCVCGCAITTWNPMSLRTRTLRDVDRCVCRSPRSWISSVSVQPPLQGSTSESIWLVLRDWG